MGETAVYEHILSAREQGEPVLLATVVKTAGSVPRHAGSKMLLSSDGDILAGTIGGGEMESRVIEESCAIFAMDHPTPRMLIYELVDPASGDPGVCGGQVELFLEPIMPEPTLLIIGAGHVGQALADLADWIGFRVVVSDDRADLCTPEIIPQADAFLVCKPEAIAEQATIHARTYIAAVTRGVPLDVEMLPGLLASPAPYIGVMGSRRRWATAVKQLRERGIADSDLARIHAPVGLELHAETPREIAVSIMAEIMAASRGASAAPMQWLGTMQDANRGSLPNDNN